MVGLFLIHQIVFLPKANIFKLKYLFALKKNEHCVHLQISISFIYIYDTALHYTELCTELHFHIYSAVITPPASVTMSALCC